MAEIKTPQVDQIKLNISNSPQDFEIQLVPQDSPAGISIYKLSTRTDTPKKPQPITLKWKFPSKNIKGVWKTASLHEKRQQYDWEQNHLQSRISVDAPVVCVFGHDDTNCHTFACSDAINLVEMNALLREEDNSVHCHIRFFAEPHPGISHYETEIRIDSRCIPFSQSLQEVALWWESFESLRPAPIPEAALQPLYSTWYQFHQNLEVETILEECTIARQLGYKVVLIDDGWQTMDNNRGYDYTGDWEPDRIPDMAGFVENVHALDMKIGIWFSVPFCGKKSKAYQKFKGKFLTENHRWAPVFDPRYPEVRAHLISIYTHALKAWNLDGLKLDFIDDFQVYGDTVLTKENGRDYANVNEAVERLMTDVMTGLREIKPDVFIEFRQKYIGPAMRKFGNMFRAFDCPNDSISNRIKTTDVKLLMGASPVHADMFTWHRDERVEIAALQFLNGLFAVPQLSVLLKNMPNSHIEMIRFYTAYWSQHAEVLMKGQFIPINPLANYPLLTAQKDSHLIIGVYDDIVVDAQDFKTIDLINAKTSNYIVMRSQKDLGEFELQTWDCQGRMQPTQTTFLSKGLMEIEVPISGMVRLTRK